MAFLLISLLISLPNKLKSEVPIRFTLLRIPILKLPSPSVRYNFNTWSPLFFFVVSSMISKADYGSNFLCHFDYFLLKGRCCKKILLCFFFFGKIWVDVSLMNHLFPPSIYELRETIISGSLWGGFKEAELCWNYGSGPIFSSVWSFPCGLDEVWLSGYS